MNGWRSTTIAELEAEASAATGLSDFGEPSYRDGLSVLLSDFERCARFSNEGAARSRAMLVGLLAQRLRTERRLADADPAPIRRPWFIIAMPRSGTTALHRLLCADPGAQGLEYWLGNHPQPRPPRAEWPANADFRATESAIDHLNSLTPDVFAQHRMAADMVDECRLLFMQSFANMSFFSLATAPNYAEWLWTCDMAPAYARYQRLLGLIDGGSGRRWVLKDPSHLMALPALSATQPDLRAICTRRPAVDFLPSVAALVYGARRADEPETSRETVGREALATWSRAAHALVAWRKANPQIPWVDVDQRALRADPIGTCRSIYEQLDEPFDAEAEQALEDLMREGLHAGVTREKLTLEQFGITRAEVERAFPEEFL